jgi:hypothetical protein
MCRTLKSNFEKQEVNVLDNLYNIVLLGSVTSAYTISISILESQENITLTTIINYLLEENRKLAEYPKRSKIVMLINRYPGKLETRSHKAGKKSGVNHYSKSYKSLIHNDTNY